ncbi:MAG: Rrf2 family transcriptional regulator [Bacteroidota bacterium]
MGRIVGLSEAASIAIHVTVLIAKSGEVNMNVIRLSELTGASKNHIAKVMQHLVKFNFVRSTRGPAGGFVLNKAPSEISLLDVYEAVEGDMALADCPFDKQICPFNKCLMNGIVHRITDELKEYFKNQKISDLI